MKAFSEADAKPFQLVAGNPALDLVNTLDFRFRESGPEELLNSYDDLQRFLNQSDLLGDADLRRTRKSAGTEAERLRTLDQVKHLREALATVCYAWLESRSGETKALTVLEKYFKQASADQQLITQEFRFAWAWKESAQLSAPVRLLAREAENFLLSDQLTRLRTCASDSCRWLFLDTSKNHTRRWCDMKICGNRMKARRYQAKLAGD